MKNARIAPPARIGTWAAMAAVAALALTSCAGGSAATDDGGGGSEAATITDVSIVVPADPGGDGTRPDERCRRCSPRTTSSPPPR